LETDVKKIRAVLFDLDGVLVDACEWHYLSLNKALKNLVGIEISRKQHIEEYNGLPTRVKLKNLGIAGEIAEKVWKLKQKLTVDIIEKNSHILKEKIELHSFLRRNRIKICCVTNSIRQTAYLMLKNTGQLKFVDFLLTNEDVENNKPYPDCYNLAVDMLNIDPSEILIVEDSLKGVKAAENSVVDKLWKVKNASEVTLINYRRYMDENFNTYGGRGKPIC
jgi:beta-phosphoglucomutase